MAHVLNEVLLYCCLASCIRHGHCRRSSGLDQLRSANKTSVIYAGSSWRTARRDLFGLLRLDVAPAALAALFGHCVHISQNVAGDRVAKPAKHKSRYRNADFRPSAFRLV